VSPVKVTTDHTDVSKPEWSDINISSHLIISAGNTVGRRELTVPALPILVMNADQQVSSLISPERRKTMVNPLSSVWDGEL